MPSGDPCRFDTLDRLYRVSRRDIWYLHFIFEAYDGLGTVSTLDRSEGIIKILIPSSCTEEALQLIEAVAREIRLEEMVATTQDHGVTGNS
jgi:hypothetical protein